MRYRYQTADSLNYLLLKQFVKENRRYPTEAETIMWSSLRGNQLGKPFRKQHIIGNYIADFVCLPAMLIVEVDGLYHQLPDQQSSDELRTKELNDMGFKVIRFRNEEVIANPEGVINEIKKNIEKL